MNYQSYTNISFRKNNKPQEKCQSYKKKDANETQTFLRLPKISSGLALYTTETKTSEKLMPSQLKIISACTRRTKDEHQLPLSHGFGLVQSLEQY